ncbi:MAG TPA: hypothetical protein VFQ15_10005 [Jiangellaceae bacterium]|nr:hypothetical protein [Jiangellaceae bacterium]
MSTDDERAWAEIVESFHASPDVEAGATDARPDRRWPEIEDVSPDARAEPFTDATFTLGSTGDDLPHLSRPEARREDVADDHFQPPLPPPLPRGDLISRSAWAGVIAAPLGLIIATVTPWDMPRSLLGILSVGFVCGFVTLVVRMREHDPYDPDNGAVL